MPHSPRGLESGLASEGVEATEGPGTRSQATRAEHSRVFMSATPPPFGNAERTRYDTARRAPKLLFNHTNTVTSFAFMGQKGHSTPTETLLRHTHTHTPSGFVHFDSLAPVQTQARNSGSSWESQVPPLKARALTEDKQRPHPSGRGDGT